MAILKRKFPMIFQSETVECGLAVLAMILQYHGFYISLSELRRRHILNLCGLSLVTLVDIAKQYGLLARVFRVELDDLRQLNLPIILHWNLNHFVMLTKISANSYTIHDPGKGIVRLAAKQFSDHFSGFAVECQPTNKFQLRPKIRTYAFLKFIQDIPQIKLIILRLFIFSVFYQTFLILAPSYLNKVISRLSFNAPHALFFSVLVGYLGLRILMALARVLKSICLLHLDSQVSLALGSTVVSRIMRLPLAYFEKRKLGDILHRLDSIEQLRQIVSNGLFEGGWCVLLFISLLMIMIWNQPLLASISGMFAALFIVFRLPMAKIQQMKTAEMLMAKSQEQICLIENMRGIQPIKIFSQEKNRSNYWIKHYKKFLTAAYPINFYKMIMECSKELLFSLEFAAIVLISAFQISQERMSFSTFYLYLFYRQQLNETLFFLLDKCVELKSLTLYEERLDDIMHHPVEKQAVKTNTTPADFSLQLSNISYRHADNEDLIFSAINAQIKQGECVVFVGASGVGKSTLLKIMMGLLQPVTGHVAIGSMPLQEICNPRQYMASVMQDDCLLGGTIAQNISFFSNDMNITKVMHCAKLVGMEMEINRMPMKFNTLVGDMGATLSGGQKQRILLARALYAEPKLLFLDEATSHLDAENERLVNQAIKSLGITCVMVAHRQETIKMADRIISLENAVLLKAS